MSSILLFTQPHDYSLAFAGCFPSFTTRKVEIPPPFIIGWKRFWLCSEDPHTTYLLLIGNCRSFNYIVQAHICAVTENITDLSAGSQYQHQTFWWLQLLSIKYTQDFERRDTWKVTIKSNYYHVFSTIWRSASALQDTLVLLLPGASVKCTKVKAKQYSCVPTWTLNTMKALHENVCYPYQAPGQQKIKIWPATANYPSHNLSPQKKKGVRVVCVKPVIFNIIHMVKYFRHTSTHGFLHEGNTVMESKRVNS